MNIKWNKHYYLLTVVVVVLIVCHLLSVYVCCLSSLCLRRVRCLPCVRCLLSSPLLSSSLLLLPLLWWWMRWEFWLILHAAGSNHFGLYFLRVCHFQQLVWKLVLSWGGKLLRGEAELSPQQVWDSLSDTSNERSLEAKQTRHAKRFESAPISCVCK